MHGSLGLALLRRAGDDFVRAEHDPVDETAECAVGTKREGARDVAAVDCHAYVGGVHVVGQDDLDKGIAA